jgi:hypothetical protein
MAGAHQQHGIPVDHAAVGVDEDRAIAVAVEGHAHGTPAVADRPGE